VISVALTFYTAGPHSLEQTRWADMPQVPAAGDTVHYSLTDDPDDSRAWRVMHVSWAHENGVWHAELGLD